MADAILGHFSHGVMIPAFAEGQGLVDALASIPAASGGVLVVAVVNRPEDATAVQTTRHDESLAAIAQRWPVITDGAETALPPFASLHAWHNGTLLVLDVRVSRRRGVGLARKIGCDVLLRLWANGTLEQPWLHMSDADSRWPADFFERPVFTAPTLPAPAALVRTYIHEAAAEGHADACLRYEARLRHHVLGLQWAGSPYAYEAIGSTISCHAVAYAQVRGVPSRPAAEDFYLLNKLAKMGAIRTVRGAPMRVSGRVSDRVPFGTGAALSSAVANARLPRCYEPRLFALLRLTLVALDRALVDEISLAESLATVGSVGEIDVLHTRLWDDASGQATDPLHAPTAEKHSHEAHSDGPPTLHVLWLQGIEERGLAQVVANVQATGLPLAKRRRRLRDQVDAFATLKLMHAWRTRGLPDVAVEDAVHRSPFCVDAGIRLPAEASQPQLEVVLRELAALELTFEFGTDPTQ